MQNGKNQSMARRNKRAFRQAGQRRTPAPSPHVISVCPFCPFGRALGFGARERSERVTVRRQPHRQLRRRLVYKPSARLTAILTFAANLRHRKVVPLLQKSMLIVLETVLILLHILMQSAKI